MLNRRFLSQSTRLAMALALLVQVLAFARPGAAAAVPAPLPNVNDLDRIVLTGNVHVQARAEFEIGRTDPNLKMERMILLLAPREGGEADLAQLQAAQHDPSSPLFHQWLTPEDFGGRFGIPDEQLRVITTWLENKGFTIDEVSAGRGSINFSGTAAQVERAFATEIHDYKVDGVVRHANAIDPSIPRALGTVVKGVVSLNSFPRRTLHHAVRPVSVKPEFVSGGSNFLAPGDFATIYDLNSVYSAGITGTGQSIGIVARTDITISDVTTFRSMFGLPVNNPTLVHNGTDPGNLGGGEETEADLDTEWSGAVAKGASVMVVVSASTSTTDGVDLSAQYIVTHNLTPVMSTSFGQCESTMGTTELAFYNSLWSQAATQGQTAMVSSGDAGAAGCNVGGDTTGSGQAVSGLCSTPFNVCVGGTEFNEGSMTSTYWGTTNSSTDTNALSYIPEKAWNESGTVSGGANLWSSGGGVSNTYSKPAFQSAPGVPADGKRDVPDVALSAAGHDAYLIVQDGSLSAVGGTSAASPSFAGLMALVVQKTGARQGNANTVLYPMATSQYSSGGPAAFHDITLGNNSVPGVTGFSCTTGYDEVTGLGSVDGAVLINNWGATASPNFTIAVSPTSGSIVQGGSGSATVTTTVSGGFSNAITLSASGQPTGVTVGFSPNPIAAPGAGTSTMSITVASTTATGTYTITVTGTGGSTTHTATYSLTVTSASCTPPAAPTGLTATASGQTTINLTWTASSGATSYTILRSTTSGGPYTSVGTSTTTSFSNTGLTCNTAYFYVVTASNGSCSSGNSAQATATTAACSTCTNTTLYSNTFETGTGLSNWSTGTFVSGGSTADWRGIQVCAAHSGTHIFRFGGTSCTAAYGNNRFAFSQPNGTAGIAVASTAKNTTLSFWHHYGFESGFDGGTLTLSVNGSNYFFIPAADITSGSSYNGTISADCPPSGAAGAPVFTGTQTAFVNTVVNLDAACNLATGLTTGCAGQSIRIGFTSITDCSNTSTGWFLDDVTVTDCQ